MPRPQRKAAARRKPAPPSSTATADTAAPEAKENRDAQRSSQEQPPPAPAGSDSGDSPWGKRRLSEPEQGTADERKTPPKRALATPPDSASPKRPRYGRRRSTAARRLSLTPVAVRHAAQDRLSSGGELVFDTGLIDGISPIKPGRPAESDVGLGLSDHGDDDAQELSVPLHGLLARQALSVDEAPVARTRAAARAASKVDTPTPSASKGGDSASASDSDDFDLDALVAQSKPIPVRKGAPAAPTDAGSNVELPSRHRTQKAIGRAKAKPRSPASEDDGTSDSNSDAPAETWQPKKNSRGRRTTKAQPTKQRNRPRAKLAASRPANPETKSGPTARSSAADSKVSRYFDDIDNFELVEENI